MTGKFNHGNTFRNQFEKNCIKLLILAYQEVINKKSIDLTWEENDITARLYEYIEKNKFRLEKGIHANVEPHLADNSLLKVKGFASKYSRIDMKFAIIKNGLEHKYFAEAKLLKEKDSALKRRYIETGIDNFKNGKYYNGCLVGYIVEGVLFNAIEGINKLLIKDQRNTEILKKNMYKHHNEYYESHHNSTLILKHLMFDFTCCGKADAA